MKYQPGLLTVVYVAMLTFCVGSFALQPSGNSLVALACVVPAVAISLAFPTRRKAGRA
jgi:hypothetical protein